jgi:DNA-binding LacI/PurR family transcriptional regulator
VTASRAIVDRLIGLGHRLFRYVREADGAPASTDRERGVFYALAAAGLSTRTSSCASTTAGWVRRWQDIGVPAVVVGETDTRPVVTGFEVPRREMGRRAVRLLTELVGPGARRPATRLLLTCPPVAGTTVGLAPKSA